MRAGIQTSLLRMGEEGCYFLCLLRAADYQNDVLDAYYECLEDGLIEEDCFVNDPVGVFNKYSDVKVNKVVKATNVVDNPKVIIAQYENGVYRHFVLDGTNIKINECVQDRDGNTVWDPLGLSNCVAKGKRIGYRLFY